MNVNIFFFFLWRWVLQCSSLHSSLCRCVHRSILTNSSVTAQQMCIASAASSSSAHLATTGHDWRICSGFTPTWSKYPRLPIRTKISFVCCFLLSLSHTDHIDRSWKLQTGKKRSMSAVFSTVFWDYTLMISWIFCYCTFCNGCR